MLTVHLPDDFSEVLRYTHLHMNTTMIFTPLAILNGSLIAIMILFNTLLGSAVGLTFSILVIQSAGLLLTLLLSLLRSHPKGSPAPAYLRIGGALGVPIVLLNTICFLNIGASLTLACGVLGQASASLGADLTGFLGVRRYAFEKQKLIGFLLSLVGVAVMAVGGSFSPLYILLAFSAGIITIIQMIINSQLAVRIGLFRSTRSNFVGGSSPVRPSASLQGSLSQRACGCFRASRCSISSEEAGSVS